MTPLHLQLLLHYHTRPTPYAELEPEHASSRAVTDYRKQLIAWGLLRLRPYGIVVEDDTRYETTERGRAFIEALLRMPLPEIEWVIPGFTPPALTQGPTFDA